MKTIGHEVHSVVPTLEFPRHTEATFAVLNDGTIIMAYNRHVGSSDDSATSDIYAIFSHDDGETWGDGRVLIAKSKEETNIMCPMFIRLNDGALGLIYSRKVGPDPGHMDCRPVLRRSYDEGETWSDFTYCIDEPGYYVSNNDRIIRLKSGRVIIPTSCHPNCRDRAESCFFISDDDCHTFHEAKQRLHLPFEHRFTGMQETGAAQLSDGTVWGFARTGHGYQFQAFSEDEGETWSNVAPNEYFTSPNSPMSVKWVNDEKMVAVFNPIPIYNGRYPHYNGEKKHYDIYHPFSVYEGRTPLVCAVGDGTIKGFDRELRYLEVDEPDPFIGYCYTGILAHKDYVLFAYSVFNYDYGYKDLDIPIYGIRIKKVMLDEL
ncbi:MAG: exo-alpha-sialidase [Clostridia bacterium]|nr:exo-alpha-sialidase [Clostridia bacterium]